MNRILTIFLITAVLTISCRKIFFTDEVRSREIILDNFSAVNIVGIYNLVLVQDSANMLEISGKNNIGSIDALVINDTLHISDHKVLSFNPYKNTITLHFTDLKYMVTHDPVNVINKDTLKADRFSYEAIGEIAEVRLTVICNTFLVANSANTLGFFHFSGRAGYTSYFNRYGCTIFADSLFTKEAVITNESVGDVYINASENIRVFIWGPGNIYYYGDPAVEIAENKGTGKIIRLK